MRQERMEEEAKQKELDQSYEVIAQMTISLPCAAGMQDQLIIWPAIPQCISMLQAKQAALRQAEEEKTAKRRAKRLKKKVHPAAELIVKLDRGSDPFKMGLPMCRYCLHKITNQLSVMVQSKRRKTAGADGVIPPAGDSDSDQSDDQGVEQVGLD